MRWIAVDCRSFCIVKDKGLQEAPQIALASANYELPTRKTMLKKCQQPYEDEREVKQGVAPTGDHWTSVSNNYLMCDSSYYR